ncbi:MAG TPA: hypothetical protein VFE01_00600, partial [Terracidiphilus sp.]|nr:hypothetical protein [Terracidiphilus sp.]
MVEAEQTHCPMRTDVLTSKTYTFRNGSECNMPRVVRCSIIQASNAVPATEPLAVQKKAMIEKHLGLIRKAAADGAQIVCLQEIFNGPYFCAEQSIKWYEATESVPDGP